MFSHVKCLRCKSILPLGKDHWPNMCNCGAITVNQGQDGPRVIGAKNLWMYVPTNHQASHREEYPDLRQGPSFQDTLREPLTPEDLDELDRLFRSNPKIILRLLCDRATALNRQLAEKTKEAREAEELAYHYQRLYDSTDPPCSTRNSPAREISSICQGHTVMTKECVTRLLQQYVDILNAPYTEDGFTEANHFLDQSLPSLMATLAHLNDHR